MYNEIAEDREFNEIIDEILTHEEFQKLRDIRHHDTNIYEHAVKVAFMSYRISKGLGLDYHSTTRGALLHDFFFYDWREEKPSPEGRDRLHAFSHPKTAYRNARKHFTINAKEKDIIVKHMFPLTISLPRYRESFVVLMVDKIVAAGELLSGLGRALVRRPLKVG